VLRPGTLDGEHKMDEILMIILTAVIAIATVKLGRLTSIFSTRLGSQH